MTIEEKVMREQWYVLQKIKEEAYRTVAGNYIFYWVNYGFFGGDDPTPGNEIKALEKLEELGAIKIMNPGGTGEYE